MTGGTTALTAAVDYFDDPNTFLDPTVAIIARGSVVHSFIFWRHFIFICPQRRPREITIVGDTNSSVNQPRSKEQRTYCIYQGIRCRRQL